MKSKDSWRNKFLEIFIVFIKIVLQKNHYSIRYNKKFIPVIRSGKGLKLLKPFISNLAVCESGILSSDILLKKYQYPTITSYSWRGLIGKAEHLNNPKQVYKASVSFLVRSCKEVVDHKFIFIKNNRPSPPPYNHLPGWKSAHTQIGFIQLLSRAYKIEQNSKYALLIVKALNGFYISVEDGGFTNKISEESWWYLKFAESSSKDLRILNSMLFILIGLYELTEIDTIIKGKQRTLIEKGENALLDHLPLFDSGSWSYYDNKGNSSGNHYHVKHIDLLERMYELTGRKKYKHYATQFHNYIDSKETL